MRNQSVRAISLGTYKRSTRCFARLLYSLLCIASLSLIEDIITNFYYYYDILLFIIIIITIIIKIKIILHICTPFASRYNTIQDWRRIEKKRATNWLESNSWRKYDLVLIHTLTFFPFKISVIQKKIYSKKFTAHHFQKIFSLVFILLYFDSISC